MTILWQNVRLKGGAYGGFSAFASITGNWYFASYRDPNLKETIDIYKETADFLAKHKLSEEEIEKVIIGTIQGLDKPLTAQQKGEKAFRNYLQNITQEIVQKFRDEVLNTKAEDFENAVKMFKDIAENGKICVVGPKNKLEESKELFSSIKNVFEG